MVKNLVGSSHFPVHGVKFDLVEISRPLVEVGVLDVIDDGRRGLGLQRGRRCGAALEWWEIF